MIFLAVFGGIALVLAVFYLLNSIQSYGTWRFATLLVVVFALITGYGVVKLPVWHHHGSWSMQSSSSSSTTKAALTKAASVFNPNQAAIDGETAGQKSAATANAQSQVKSQLANAFSSLGTVTLDADTKTYTIHPTNKDAVKALEELEKTPSDAEEAKWPTMTDHLRASSANISKSLKDDYTLAMVSPDQSGKVLYSAKNGKTVTNFIK
ncbi:hypothetical protein [Furfurilactobacillus entadae]|uniref:hypothetical protein n=1 Tax=Furfurilactobacillus entadae TaxID=2922307 RepID=UPI0035EA018D